MQIFQKLALLTATATLALSGCSALGIGDSEKDADKGATIDPAEVEKAEKSNAAQPKKDGPGAFVSLDDYKKDEAGFEDTELVLFFDASWCPTCKEMRKWLDQNEMPDGITLIDLDYDKETGLRKKYGVTVQHTFVHIDSDGDELKSWTGSVSGEEIQKQLS